ncbi:histidine kinase [Ottowia beijingensis]|uniref:Histidine kinase n=2 Tax=Pseudomonadota TaxID=1224 RepID=A0A853IZ35_9BURK|nr:helix-turn-helix domain-containing protein [Ottowia beijingensis]NZA03193.1 histidine kinase [Ottowia beijingensis]
MKPRDRLQQIEQTRRALLTSDVPPDQLLHAAWNDRAWLLRSWQRCLAQGQRPEQPVSFDAVPAAARQRADEAHRSLLAAARPEMQRLARAVAPIRYFAILTDAAGAVIDTAGAIDRRDRRAEAIARVGVDLSERSIGTSAIGAALGEQQPVWLHRGEHFFRDTSVYSCAGAPLTGPKGQCLGMLDLTGIEAPERPELQHLVARSARAIEDALLHATPHALRLHLAWGEALPGETAHAVLCLDAGGAVLGANSAARQMLPALAGLAHGGVHAGDLFALPWQHLFDLAGRDAPSLVPLWSGLRIAVQAVRPGAPAASPAPATPRLPLKALEERLIQQAVRDASGNVAEAARALGLSRATLYRRLAATRGASVARR